MRGSDWLDFDGQNEGRQASYLSLPNARVTERPVREDPDHAYEPEFQERFANEACWYPGR